MRPAEAELDVAAEVGKMIERLIKKLLYGGSTSFRPYERTCLDSFRKALSHESQSILDSQLQTVNVIQRFSNDKLVIIQMDPGEARLFPNSSAELYVASVVLSGKAGQSSTCEIVCHKGRISSLEFKRSPMEMFSGTNSCTGIEIFEDLMTPPVEPSERAPEIEENFLATIRKYASVDQATGPASKQERSVFLKRLNFSVPFDYLGLLEETNSFTVNGWKFLGTRGRRILLPDRSYFVAAERIDSKAALCFLETDSSPPLVFYDEINDEHRSFGLGFVDAFMAALEESPP